MKKRIEETTVVVRGAGELASGVIRRLALAGFRVVALEREKPECVRRAVCFAEAVYEGEFEVEGVTAKLLNSPEEVSATIKSGMVPLLVDPEGKYLKIGKPDFLIDARMVKRDQSASLNPGSIAIGLGPGFEAGRNCHAAVETNRGIDLGRVIYKGSPQVDTGIPAAVEGKTTERVVRAPAEGIFRSSNSIGDQVNKGDKVGEVAGQPVKCAIGGVLRGLIRDGTTVGLNQKIGDIDPRGIRDYCFKISDKANAVAGGVMEAVLHLRQKNESD